MFYDAPFTDDCDKVPRVSFEMVAEKHFEKKHTTTSQTHIHTHACKQTNTHTHTHTQVRCFNAHHCVCLYGGSCFIAACMITTLTMYITGVHWFSVTTCECIKFRLDLSDVWYRVVLPVPSPEELPAKLKTEQYE